MVAIATAWFEPWPIPNLLVDDVYRDKQHTELTRRWLLLEHPLKLVMVENLEFGEALSAVSCGMKHAV